MKARLVIASIALISVWLILFIIGETTGAQPFIVAALVVSLIAFALALAAIVINEVEKRPPASYRKKGRKRNGR